MKKILVTCLISFASVAFAQTCPTADEIFIKQGNRYDVVAPPGWRVEHASRDADRFGATPAAPRRRRRFRAPHPATPRRPPPRW